MADEINITEGIISGDIIGVNPPYPATDAQNDSVTSSGDNTNVTSNDTIYTTIRKIIRDAATSKKTYVVLTISDKDNYSTLPPATQKNYDALIGVTNEERTEFDETKGNLYKVLEGVFVPLGYKWCWGYDRNKSLPNYVLISWAANNEDGTDPNFKKLLEDKYAKFVYPKYHYFLTTKQEVTDSITAQEENLNLTDILERTFMYLSSQIKFAISNNNAYIPVLWEDINKNSAEIIRDTFFSYTEENGYQFKTHSWTQEDKIGTFRDYKVNYSIAQIDKDDTFTIQNLLTSGSTLLQGTEENSTGGHGFYWDTITNVDDVPLGFIISWDNSQETRDKILSVLQTYSTLASETTDTLVLSIFHKQAQANNYSDIAATARTNYIASLTDKIQSKLNSAFSTAANSPVAILWTELSSTNAADSRLHWTDVTAKSFNKILKTKIYKDEPESEKVIAANTTSVTIDGTPQNLNMQTALKALDIARKLGDNVSESNRSVNAGVYWEYLHYENTNDPNGKNALTLLTTITPETSCGIAFVYNPIDNDGGATWNKMETFKTKYRTTRDPAIKVVEQQQNS